MKKFILITLFALFPVISHQEPLTEKQHVSINLSQQIECMARNIYYEAASECMIVARKALTEHKLHDTIHKTKSMYYHNNKVNPGWNLKYVARIGNHLFYTR